MLRFLLRASLLLPLAFASCATSSSESDPIEGKSISAVAIRSTGPIEVDEVRLTNYIRTKPRSRYSSARVDSDIKSLYESGHVDDVRVLAEPRGDTIDVIFEVTTRPSPGFGAVFTGNTVFSDPVLAKVTGFQKNQWFSKTSLLIACRKLEEFYRSHGYPHAKVSASLPAGNELVADIPRFTIEEGRKSTP